MNLCNSKQKSTVKPPELIPQLQWLSARGHARLICIPSPFFSSFIICKEARDIISQPHFKEISRKVRNSSVPGTFLGSVKSSSEWNRDTLLLSRSLRSAAQDRDEIQYMREVHTTPHDDACEGEKTKSMKRNMKCQEKKVKVCLDKVVSERPQWDDFWVETPRTSGYQLCSSWRGSSLGDRSSRWKGTWWEHSWWVWGIGMTYSPWFSAGWLGWGAPMRVAFLRGTPMSPSDAMGNRICIFHSLCNTAQDMIRPKSDFKTLRWMENDSKIGASWLLWLFLALFGELCIDNSLRIILAEVIKLFVISLYN